MTRTALLSVLLLVQFNVVLSSFGQDSTVASAPKAEQAAKPASKAIPVAELAKPTAMPDRVILTLIGDSATERAVTWRTSMDVQTPMAEIGVADATPDFPTRARQIKAITQPLKTDLNEALFHSVRFVGLSPATTYAYRVGDGDNWSEWHHFKTAATNAEPFSFIYFGDAQNNLRSMWSRVVRQAFRQAPQAAFLLHAGDLVNSAQADEEWGQWFTAGSWVNAVMPNVAIPGNHEQFKREDGTRRLSHHWRTQFELPLNGPAGLEETCFTFVYHNTRFVALNSNEQLDVQAKWLDDLLEKDNSKWVICAFHHPIYSTAKDRDNPLLRATWKPIFDKHRVDLVLQGHDHSYGRTGFEVPEKIELPPKESAAAANPNAATPSVPPIALHPQEPNPRKQQRHKRRLPICQLDCRRWMRMVAPFTSSPFQVPRCT